MNSKKILTMQEAAKVLGLNYNAMLRLAKTHNFPAFRVGERKIMVFEDDLYEWCRRKSQEPIE